MKYHNLCKPLRINKMELRNRIAFPPMNTNYCNENGAATPLMSQYYARRAKGGAALVTVEATAINLLTKNHGAQPHLSNTSVIPGWSRLVDQVHRYGAKISIELNHWGADGTVNCGVPEVSSSDVTTRGPGYAIHSLTLDEIRELQKDYVQAIIYAKQAGFDAATFHAAHGNIMPQFFSSFFNKRTDWYGGCFENRIRFAREIVEMARKAVGESFPLIMRISGKEYITGGRELDETIAICKRMEEAGIDAFEVSGGVQDTYLFSISSYNFPGMKGFLMESAKAIKNAVGVPVIGVGGVRDPGYAEQLLEEGFADMISLGRAQVADPDFCRKALRGAQEDIRPCISCNNCLQVLDRDRFLTCAVNPETGREDVTDQIKVSAEPKKVLIVGGGPAGMEAARVAGMCGHKITLLEQAGKLGGSMYPASLPPHKESIASLIDWYKVQLKKLGVEIKLNSAFVPGELTNYDTVLLATGASYLRSIPGSDLPNVLTAVEALEQHDKVGKRVVVIGGGATGCEIAEHFGAREIDFSIKEKDPYTGTLQCTTWTVKGETNRNVTIVEMLPELGMDMMEFTRIVLLKKLLLNGVEIICSSKVHEITAKKVRVMRKEHGDLIELEADTVILAGGLKQNRIGHELGAVHIGDANSPGRIVDAIRQGFWAGLDL